MISQRSLAIPDLHLYGEFATGMDCTFSGAHGWVATPWNGVTIPRRCALPCTPKNCTLHPVQLPDLGSLASKIRGATAVIPLDERAGQGGLNLRRQFTRLPLLAIQQNPDCFPQSNGSILKPRTAVSGFEVFAAHFQNVFDGCGGAPHAPIAATR